MNTFGTRFFSAILNLLITIVISRFLGPEGKGQQGIIIATIAYILVFSNLMGGGTIVYLVPRYAYYLIMLPAYLWSVLTSLVFLIIFGYTSLIAQEFILNICILSVINAFTSINSTILIGKEKIKASNFIALIQPLVIIISLVVFFFILKQKTIQSYFISLYFAFSISLLISLIYMIRFCTPFRFSGLRTYFGIIREMIKFGLLNQLAHIFQLLSFRMSYYWLEKTLSESEVGIYSNGTSLIESIWLISRSISLVQYARIANTTDKPYAQNLTLNLAKAGLILSFALLLVMVFLPPSFYIFIYGEGFGEISYVIRSLAPGVLFFNIALIVGHYFSGIGKYHINTISSFAGLVVSIALFTWMIPSMGIIGAGIATSISYTVTSLIVFFIFIKESKLQAQTFLPRKADIDLFYKEFKRSLSNKNSQEIK